MLLVLSHSEDVTTDVVLNRLTDLEVFRFNMDLWQQYDWQANPDSFLLKDPTGRECRDEDVHAVYLRKLFFNPAFIDVPAGGSEEAWTRSEVEEFWLGLRDLAMETDKLALVHPSPRGRWNKMRQMRVAARHFRVPEWSAYHSATCPMTSPLVVKSFGQQNIGEGSLLMVQEADPSALAPDYPWFVQRKVSSATHDVTVAYVDGRMFAFELSRSSFAGTDCRFPTTIQNLQWQFCELSPSESKAVTEFMESTGYSFGRIDFLRDSDGLWFLELNPNGQFAWLDPYGEHGLLDAVADGIRRVHLRNETLCQKNPRSLAIA